MCPLPPVVHWVEPRWFASKEEALEMAPEAEIGWFDFTQHAPMAEVVTAATRLKWLNSIYAGLDFLPLDLLARQAAQDTFDAMMQEALRQRALFNDAEGRARDAGEMRVAGGIDQVGVGDDEIDRDIEPFGGEGDVVLLRRASVHRVDAGHRQQGALPRRCQGYRGRP